LFDWTADFERHTFFLKPFAYVSSSLGKFEKRFIDGTVNRLAKSTVVFAHLLGWVDKNVVDGGVRLTAFSVRSSGQLARRIQNGRIQSYFVASAVGIFLLIIWMAVM
jgi:NADH-quinone oxidoreductase subunit L